MNIKVAALTVSEKSINTHNNVFFYFQVFWSYIVGMLSNLDSLPIERIHSILRMFAMQGTSAMECSLQELKIFLDRKVKEQSLIFTGGAYKLPKTN